MCESVCGSVLVCLCVSLSLFVRLLHVLCVSLCVHMSDLLLLSIRLVSIRWASFHTHGCLSGLSSHELLFSVYPLDVSGSIFIFVRLPLCLSRWTSPVCPYSRSVANQRGSIPTPIHPRPAPSHLFPPTRAHPLSVAV